MGKDRVRQDLFIAAYADDAAAERDWKTLQRMAADKVIELDELALLNRDTDGNLRVGDASRRVGSGAAIGAVGGAVLGLLFPPSLLVSAAVGAGVGAGSGAIMDSGTKKRIKGEVEWAVAPGGSGVVVVLDQAWASEVKSVLSDADNLVQHHLDDDDEDQIETFPPATGR